MTTDSKRRPGHSRRLEAENARLRDENDRLENACIDREAENARLKARVEALVKAARHVNRDLKSTFLAEAIDAALAAAEKGTNARLP